MRVLVSVSPRMYREAIALSIQRNRPGIEVRISPPEAAEEELAAFRPDLLIHDDTVPIPEEVLEGIPTRVEMLYSDSMDARDGLPDARHVHRRPAQNLGRGGGPGWRWLASTNPARTASRPARAPRR
jgi:hypothetical protein